MRAALAVLALAGLESAALAKEPLPYRVEVKVGYGTPVGPDSVRQEIESGIRRELSLAHCFRAVGTLSTPAGPDEVRLALQLDEFVEETSYETTLHEQSASRDPEVVQAVSARASALVSLAVETADGQLLRTRRYRQESLGNTFAGDDVEATARALLIQQVVRAAHKFACSGSAADWEKRLRQTR